MVFKFESNLETLMIQEETLALRDQVNQIISKYFTCINCADLLEKPLVYNCLGKDGHFTCESCETERCEICDEKAKAVPFPLIEQFCIALRRTRNILNGKPTNIEPKPDPPAPHMWDVFGSDSVVSMGNPEMNKNATKRISDIFGTDSVGSSVSARQNKTNPKSVEAVVPDIVELIPELKTHVNRRISDIFGTDSVASRSSTQQSRQHPKKQRMSEVFGPDTATSPTTKDPSQLPLNQDNPTNLGSSSPHKLLNFDSDSDDTGTQEQPIHQTPVPKSKRSSLARKSSLSKAISPSTNSKSSNVASQSFDTPRTKRKSSTTKAVNKRFSTPKQTPSRRESHSRQASAKAASMIHSQYAIHSETDFFNYSLSNANANVIYTTTNCDLNITKGPCVFIEKLSMNTTHLVCSDYDTTPKRTIKFLLALASGIPIVKEKFIHECVKANNLLDPINFIANGCVNGAKDAPLRSWTSKSKLFKNLNFVLLGTFHSPTKEELSKLVLAGEGSIGDGGIGICDPKYSNKYPTSRTSMDLFDIISNFDIGNLD